MPSAAGYLDISDATTAPPRPRFGWRVVTAGIAAGLTFGVVASAVREHMARRAVSVAPSQVTGLDELFSPAASSQMTNLKPLEYMHDGNPCDVNEEKFGGLCYKTCALLTNYEAPIRTSPWTCCPSHPCTPLNEKGKVGLKVMCTGFDIGSDGGCPHKPGACLVNEELHGGICYEKCSVLTGGAFPNRVGPATCCDTHGLGCLNPGHSLTNKTLNVGGGGGDHDPSTLSTPHFPQLSLTEDANSKQPEQQQPPAAESRPVSSSETAFEESSEGMAPIRIALKPLEIMDDGNPCADSEELYGGLCYKRCALLTGGQASIRTSSWTCCEQHPCYPWNQHGSLGTRLLCNGFDISADGSCPHKPGVCLLDEELYMGICYKKCSLLTEGAFPHRTAAATCCKTAGIGCLNFGNDRTSKNFDVGGGAGDHDPSTPAKPHPPMLSLTEGASLQAPRPELVHRRLRVGDSA